MRKWQKKKQVPNDVILVINKKWFLITYQNFFCNILITRNFFILSFFALSYYILSRLCHFLIT